MTDRRRDDADVIGVEAELESELNQFADEWNAIRVGFSGESPDDVESVVEWHDRLSLNLIIKSSGDCDFASAWQRAVKIVRELLYSRLVPWSCKVLNTYGIPGLSGIPNPPTNVLPARASLEDLTLTPDLVDAGTRVVVWSAASTSPGMLRRSNDHQVYFWRWAGQLLKWHRGELFPDRVIVDALRTVLQSLKPVRRIVARAAIAQDTALNREAPVSRNSIRRLSDKKYQIVFLGEVCEINGVGARRFVAICRRARISLSELMVDSDAVIASRSVDSEKTNGMCQRVKNLRPIEEMSPAEREKLLATITIRLEELERQLDLDLTTKERAAIESEQKTYHAYLNGLGRMPETSASKILDAVRSSIGRLSRKQRDLGRLDVANLIESSYTFDWKTEMFEYTGPEWEFVGF